jgi:drug/metabolite transporter (DMT)-like permease
MSVISELLSGLLDGLLGNLLPQLTENLITLGLLVFALALGFFAIIHLRRRRQTLDHQRLAAIIKGLHFAGVPPDAFPRPRSESHNHLLRGLRWLCGGAGMSGAVYTYQTLDPSAQTTEAIRGALIGLIPCALGLAHLLFSWFCARTQPPSSLLSSRMMHRAAARRY